MAINGPEPRLGPGVIRYSVDGIDWHDLGATVDGLVFAADPPDPDDAVIASYRTTVPRTQTFSVPIGQVRFADSPAPLYDEDEGEEEIARAVDRYELVDRGAERWRWRTDQFRTSPFRAARDALFGRMTMAQQVVGAAVVEGRIPSNRADWWLDYLERTADPAEVVETLGLLPPLRLTPGEPSWLDHPEERPSPRPMSAGAVFSIERELRARFLPGGYVTDEPYADEIRRYATPAPVSQEQYDELAALLGVPLSEYQQELAAAVENAAAGTNTSTQASWQALRDALVAGEPGAPARAAAAVRVADEFAATNARFAVEDDASIEDLLADMDQLLHRDGDGPRAGSPRDAGEPWPMTSF